MTTPDPTIHVPAAPLHSPGDHVTHATTAAGVTPEVPSVPAAAVSAAEAPTTPSTAIVAPVAPVAPVESPEALAARIKAHAAAVTAAAAIAVAKPAPAKPVAPIIRHAPVASAVPGVKITPPVARPLAAAAIVPKPVVKPLPATSNTVANMQQRHAQQRPLPNPTAQLITNLQRVQIAGWSLSTQAVATKASLTALAMTCTVSKDGSPSIVSNQVLYQPGPTAQATWEALALSVLVKVST